MTEELVVHHLATGQIDVIAEAAGINQVSLSADAARVAFTAIGAGAETFMQVVDLASGDTELIEADTIIAFQWSPDSRRSCSSPSKARQSPTASGTRALSRPTSTLPQRFMFRDRYLFFWGQYDRSMSLWAPDSSAFVVRRSRHRGRHRVPATVGRTASDSTHPWICGHVLPCRWLASQSMPNKFVTVAAAFHAVANRPDAESQ